MIAIGQVNKYWGRDRGGIEAVLHAEVCDLSRRGYRVGVLACRPQGSAARAFPPGVAGRELPAPVVASMPVHLGFPRALAELAAASDLLHFHLPFPLAEAAALRLVKRGPWVATLHAEVVGHAGWMRWAQRRITERFLRRVDAIVVSSASSSQVATLRPHQARVRVIPFGFDLAPFLAAPAAPGARRGRGEPPVVVFLGRLVAYKGVEVLLRAAQALPARIHIIGDGRERPRLERLARELGLGGRATFFGHLPDAELPARLRAADIFALPSCTQAETFGVAQVEAMATGLPVVNTALATGTDWVSAHGLTGLTVAPGDPVALAAALRRLIEDRPFRLACGRRARQRARALFSLETRGPELAALYGELLPGPQPRPQPGIAAPPRRMAS
ncbi:MAG TPA: glycosyltransferase [Terriglobales bacterium]|nr:glycosyltransferase [Terriglobales bacterium]